MNINIIILYVILHSVALIFTSIERQSDTHTHAHNKTKPKQQHITVHEVLVTTQSYQRPSHLFNVKLLPCELRSSNEGASLNRKCNLQEHIFIYPTTIFTSSPNRCINWISRHHFLWRLLDRCPSSKSGHRDSSTTVLFHQFTTFSRIFHYLCHFTSHWSQKPTSEILFKVCFPILFYSLPLW